MDAQNKPLGIPIIGWLNCFLFGILFFVLSLSSYFNTTPKDLEKIMEIFKNQGINGQITFQQFKVACLLYAGIASVFFVSGAGLLLRKEWARKLTLYFAFTAAILIFVSVLAAPGLIKQALLQIIYPGVLIVYLTNKNIEEYFKRNTNKRGLETNSHG